VSDKAHSAVASVLVNASNYPPELMHYVLGRDMTPLIDAVMVAVREVQRQTWIEAIHHIQPMLTPPEHRAAQADNPYEKEDTE
jgi:hypothetical protein